MLIELILSSGIGFWQTRSAASVTSAVTGQCGGSARRTDGGLRSGRSAAQAARNPALPPDDLVERNFTATNPNRLWLTDITPVCIVHSNRGSQFRSRKFLAAIRHHDLAGPMGQVGSAGDNAAMKSFFALLQKNVLNRRRWATRQNLRLAIIT